MALDRLKDVTVETYVAAGTVAFILAFIVWPVVAKRIDRYLLNKYTGMVDIDPAALPRNGEKIKGTAVIAGGSYAGLISSRILSTHFTDVVIIESETLASPDQPRKNVQQYYQIHTILQFSYGALHKLFPNLKDHIALANGRTSKSVSSYFAKGNYVKSSSDLILTPWLCMTRPGFEPMIRKMIIAECPGVRFINGTVTGFKPSTDRNEVTQVTWRPKDGKEESIDCKLLVDATGPSATGVKWLKNNSYSAPQKLHYQPNVKYWTILLPTSEENRKSVVFPHGKTWTDEDVWLYALAPDPEGGREYSIGLQRTEREELMIAVLGWGKECPVPGPEATLDDLVDFIANSDPKYEFFRKWGREILAHVRSIGEDPKGSRLLFQQCYKLDYANTKGLPKNFVCVGDSRLRVNPTYGQGLAKASIGAIALDATLRKHTHGQNIDSDFAHKYFVRESNRVDGFYDFTRIEDYAYSGTELSEGEDRSLGKWNRKYMDNLVKAAHNDAKIGSALWQCINATRPSTDLFTPHVVYKTLRQAFLGF